MHRGSASMNVGSVCFPLKFEVKQEHSLGDVLFFVHTCHEL